jgi:hypothetical protein
MLLRGGLLSACLRLLRFGAHTCRKATDVNRADDRHHRRHCHREEFSDQRAPMRSSSMPALKCITESIGEWVRIRLADGKVGWVELGVAERI